MTTGRCIRCGRTGSVEYGTDGLPYCSTCVFYGMNKQCWRCRMYIPASEMQQYRGQWVCPICLMEMRDDDRKMTERRVEKPVAQPLVYGERCERCGRETSLYYIYNGRRLCKSCLEEEQAKWGTVGGGPSAAPYRITYKEGEEGFFAKLIGRVLEFIGLKKRVPEKAEIVVAPRQKIEVREKGKKANVVAFKRGRPLSEGLETEEEEKPAEKPAPKSEGLIKKTKRYRKRKKAKKK